jgi:hypothetical protein
MQRYTIFFIAVNALHVSGVGELALIANSPMPAVTVSKLDI